MASHRLGLLGYRVVRCHCHHSPLLVTGESHAHVLRLLRGLSHRRGHRWNAGDLLHSQTLEIHVMELLIMLVLIGMVIYLLPYIIAGAFMLIGITGGLLAFLFMGIRALFKSR